MEERKTNIVGRMETRLGCYANECMVLKTKDEYSIDFMFIDKVTEEQVDGLVVSRIIMSEGNLKRLRDSIDSVLGE